jgi:hypothetical protein
MPLHNYGKAELPCRGTEGQPGKFEGGAQPGAKGECPQTTSCFPGRSLRRIGFRPG